MKPSQTLQVTPLLSETFHFLTILHQRSTIFNIYVFYEGCVQHAKPSFTRFLSPKPLVCLLT